MLEAQALHGVVKLDVDAEVVGVELQLVAVEQAAGGIDVHDQVRDRAVIAQTPMAVARRVGLEVDRRRFGFSMSVSPCPSPNLSRERERA